jgi:DNA invertase Pin-like site-specific DNA recombinase
VSLIFGSGTTGLHTLVSRAAQKVAAAGHIATARRMRADGHTARDVAKYLGVSRATLYRYLDRDSA